MVLNLDDYIISVEYTADRPNKMTSIRSSELNSGSITCIKSSNMSIQNPQTTDKKQVLARPITEPSSTGCKERVVWYRLIL